MKNNLNKPYSIEPRCSIDLTLSENPLGCSPVVTNTIRRDTLQCVPTPNRYPTSNGNLLKNQLAGILGGKTNNYFVTNGSENIIINIPRILARPNDLAIIPQLSFPLFALYCQFAGLKIELVLMKNDLGIDLAKCREVAVQRPYPSLIFICNPNNPTGMLLKRSDILDFLDRIPEEIIVIIDEANIDFGGESVINHALIRKNVIVLRTFSKGFGLAGMRIGFAVGDTELIRQLTEQTPPFPITSVSEQLAITALSDMDFVEKSKQYMTKQREIIKKNLKKLGCTVFNSQANNIFAKLPNTIEPKVFFEKLKLNDVSVVKGSKFTGFDDSYFRISPRDEKTNQQFIEIMEKILIV